MFLPHEIFLLIVEAIIDDAEAKAFDQPMTWWLHGFAGEVFDQFTIFSVDDIQPKLGGIPRHPNRALNDTLRISEVNSSAFRIVRRRFSRLPYWCPYGPTTDRVPYAWAHPKIDFFHPVIEFSTTTSNRLIIRLGNTVLYRLIHQSPRGRQITAHIQNVVFAPVLRSVEDMRANCRALLTLANLRVLHLGIRVAVEPLPEKFCGPGVVVPVDAPEVGQIRDYLTHYEALWTPLLDRGVRVILDGQTFDSNKTRYLLELCREEDGLYLRHVDPRSHWFKLRSALEIPA
ncbi:hypothetical protein CkaCkLH20_08941 [Colletotrichum karsti]|uniref:Uncharacterized protein n=1 Tax=Colletotrichum karsti TaxID=1095194 RepID=A0A9P6LID1_9PEZI|nr:uncharacterized protein CkaCkLH20_08941 [Colletotrichum karsti]KAF9873482.1 hypothetical protein CkaCkLH20_08941 [Colletotrichum karsti]